MTTRQLHAYIARWQAEIARMNRAVQRRQAAMRGELTVKKIPIGRVRVIAHTRAAHVRTIFVMKREPQVAMRGRKPRK